MAPTEFREQITQLTAQLAGRPLDANLDAWPNSEHRTESTAYQQLKQACVNGVGKGRLCDRVGGCIRYGRIFKPADDLHGFSVDVASFTGSAKTAALVRSNPAVLQRSVRVNIEAGSLNSALLPGETADSAAFDPLVKEVARKMTVKSGRKCTGIRCVFVPEALYAPVAQALPARLAKTAVGNPRNESLYRSDVGALAGVALVLSDSHGRVDVISPDVAQLQTGHGNPMPQSLHGGAGRAGGSEDLRGLRALNFYHRRSAVQARTAVLANFQAPT